eukprot:Hpha_TRINITY_DN22601_c0_g1::TRINITY_DN22601_c0_g1_i1::g.192844::m.192844
MQGTSVFFRHPHRGWVLGKVSRAPAPDHSGVVVIGCVDQADGAEIQVPEAEVAVARDDVLGDLGSDLSELPALHPATLVRCVKERFAQGSPFTQVGRNMLLYLYPRGHPAISLAALQRQATFHTRMGAHWISSAVAEVAEPDVCSLVSRAMCDAMHRGRSVVVCVGEAGDGAWLNRVWALRHRQELEVQVRGQQRLGVKGVAPAEERLFSELDLAEQSASAGLSAGANLSDQIEQLLVRLGGGTWSAPQPHSDTHLELAALLADTQMVIACFSGGGQGRRSSGELASATSHGPRPGACRATTLSYDEEGRITGWDVRAWWTARGAACQPLTVFRILANAPRTRTKLLAHHFDTRWAADEHLLATGVAFEGLSG